MCKVRLIGLKSSIRRTVGLLHEYGGTQIRKIEDEEAKSIGAMENYGEISERLVKADALATALEKYASGAKANGKSPALRQSEAEKLGREVSRLNSRMDGLANEASMLAETKKTLETFSKFSIDFNALETESLALIAGTIDSKKAFSIKARIGKITDRFEVLHKSVSREKDLAIIAIEKSKAEEAKSALAGTGFESAAIPKISGSINAELKSNEKRAKEMESERASIEKEFTKIAARDYSPLLALRESLVMEAERSGVTENFVGTENAFIMEAYLPEKNYEEFGAFAEKNFGAKVFRKKISPQSLEEMHEETPTLLDHSKVLSPFEFMTRFMSMPRSNELDPTVIFLIFFPFFYGMIVGDVIYGVVSFLLARWIVKKSAPDGILRPIGMIWMWGSIPTIIFGLVFDEFAGLPHERILEILGFGNLALYQGFERMHNIETLLAASILVGLFTVSMGFLLGFVNAMKHHDRKHAIAKLGWFGLMVFGTITISTAMFRSFPQEYLLPAALLMLVSAIPVIKVEGIIGVMEIPSVVGNVLSFARILAVGLVGVVIAMILNDLAFPSPEKGLLLFLLLPLFVVGHIFNAFLAMFEALIQGARLNFVEFYSKFFNGGGKEFAPFKAVRKYTKQ